MAPGVPVAAPAPAQAVTVLFWGHKPRKHLLRPPSMAMDPHRPMGKPSGGLYTCREEQHYPGASSWREGGPYAGQPPKDRHTRLWRLRAPAARLLVIDNAHDLVQAYERFPADFLQATGVRAAVPHEHWGDFKMPELDHVAIGAAGYDGLEVTNSGVRSPLEGDSFDWKVWFPLALVGWDVPTILWYRWAFRGAPERV